VLTTAHTAAYVHYGINHGVYIQHVKQQGSSKHGCSASVIEVKSGFPTSRCAQKPYTLIHGRVSRDKHATSPPRGSNGQHPGKRCVLLDYMPTSRHVYSSEQGVLRVSINGGGGLWAPVSSHLINHSQWREQRGIVAFPPVNKRSIHPHPATTCVRCG
jgi:hypothetical protein